MSDLWFVLQMCMKLQKKQILANVFKYTTGQFILEKQLYFDSENGVTLDDSNFAVPLGLVHPSSNENKVFFLICIYYYYKSK